MLGFKQYLEEKLIIINNGKKYGQIVFLGGGAGSGKGFTKDFFMEGEKFKVLDVDEFKRLYLKLNLLTNKYPELNGLDLKNPIDVAKLHAFIKKKGIVGKSKEIFFDGLEGTTPEKLPNILFDVTMKDMDDMYYYIPLLTCLGYETINMNLIWVLAPIDEAFVNNRSRPRQVPEDILLLTHEGVANVFWKILFKKSDIFKQDLLNGSVYIVSSKKDNTQFHPISPNAKDKKKMPAIKDFVYWQVKKPGKPLDKSKVEEAKSTILQSIPQTDNTIHIFKDLSK